MLSANSGVYFGTLLFFLLGACTHRPQSKQDAAVRESQSGVAEARSFLYSDNSGLTVATTAASVEHRLAPGVSYGVRVTGDWIHLERKQLDPSDTGSAQVLTGHRDADVVTSASALPSGGGSTDKWRVEVATGPTIHGAIRDNPASLGGTFRVSIEPDYHSYSVLLRGSIELAKRNTTLGAFAGFGHDDLYPEVPPAGQTAQWPASHQRWTGGVTLAQVLGKRLLFSAGLAGSLQTGQLASPYRRAIVRTTLFPDSVPQTRARGTGSLALSAALTQSLALHLRLGGYLDSWDIKAIIPEVSFVKELGARWLLYAQYRFYYQTPAWFYQTVYQSKERILSGDPRAGLVMAHTPGVGARFVAFQGTTGQPVLVLVAAYDFSVNAYLLLEQQVLAHVASVGLNIAY